MASLGNVGDDVSVHTHLYLREDCATLYGFSSADELRFFKTLLCVSGLGPRLALTMLSAMNLEQLATAIASGSTDLLISIPGIGKRMADRLVLELKDRVATAWITSPVNRMAEENTDVIAALVSLGYSTSEASRAVAALSVSSQESLEEKVKQALAFLAR
jgi:Holliday junction DNA helicase RuvA